MDQARKEAYFERESSGQNMIQLEEKLLERLPGELVKTKAGNPHLPDYPKIDHQKKSYRLALVQYVLRETSRFIS
jgi:hypothetical protein